MLRYGMKQVRGRSLSRTEGFTLTEILIGLAVIAVIAVFVVVQGMGAVASLNRDNAHMEIQSVITAANKYRSAFANSRSYTGVSITNLVDNGYGLAGMATGVNENAYGLTVAITAAASGADATLTYNFPDQEDCLSVQARYTDGTDYMDGVKGHTACTAATPSVLVLTLE